MTALETLLPELFQLWLSALKLLTLIRLLKCNFWPRNILTISSKLWNLRLKPIAWSAKLKLLRNSLKKLEITFLFKNQSINSTLRFGLSLNLLRIESSTTRNTKPKTVMPMRKMMVLMKKIYSYSRKKTRTSINFNLILERSLVLCSKPTEPFVNQLSKIFSPTNWDHMELMVLLNQRSSFYFSF